MNSTEKSSLENRSLTVMLAIGFVGHLVYAARVLPDPVASHFNFRGDPDNFMRLRTHLIFMACLGLGLPSFIFWLTTFFHRTAPSMLNIPNRTYWLVPERIDEAMSILYRYMRWMTNGLLLFFIGVHQLVIMANLAQPVRLPLYPFLALLGGILVALIFWIVSLYRAFRIPQ